ncbi:MAG: signal transduction histidine kinase [Limisphaerales bacterium]
MTPNAVIFRYLQALSVPEIDEVLLCDLVCSDADLLQRWLRIFEVQTDRHAFLDALRSLSPDDLRNLANVQAWALTPGAGSARLSLDLWKGVLRSALLGEMLCSFLDPSLDSSALINIRLRILLGLSGVQIPSDSKLTELHEFRGISPALLEDAGDELKVFAVVDAMETGREEVVALELLDLDAATLQSLSSQAEERCSTLVRELHINGDDEADWAHNIWLLQQIALAGQTLEECSSWQEVWARHESVCRTVFSTVPLILVSNDDQFELLGDSTLTVGVASRSSVVAQSARSNQAVIVADGPDTAVLDRQLLRKLKADEALVVAHDGVALVVSTDEDIDFQVAAGLYLQELIRRRPSQTEEEVVETDQSLDLYREKEQQRLREIVHEANNPLSIVRNYLHILELRLGEQPETKEQLQLISGELKRASEIISQARDLPEELAATDEPREREIELENWLNNVVTLQTGIAEQHLVNLRAEFSAGQALIVINDLKLGQILNNLIKNAIEASTAASEVIVVLSQRRSASGAIGYEISVEDQAGGLDQTILNSFGRPQVSTKGGEHQGLGLKIVVDLCQELEIDLEVLSTTRGTQFRLGLALKDENTQLNH